MANNKTEKAICSLKVEKGKERYLDYEYLLKTGKKNPEKLYPYSNQIASALKNKKVDIIYVALHLAAYTSKKDDGEFFKSIFEDYYFLLSHESILVPTIAAGLSGLIITKNPDLEPQITDILLNCDKIVKVKNMGLTQAYIVNAFSEYFTLSPRQADMLEFAKKSLTSKSPKAKQVSKDFIKRHGV